MVKNMENYILINTQTNVADNVVYWDGNTDQWTPPSFHIALVQASTPALVWNYSVEAKDFVLVEEIGAGQIGFTWDGSRLTTNEPKLEQAIPVAPLEQPPSVGTQTI